MPFIMLQNIQGEKDNMPEFIYFLASTNTSANYVSIDRLDGDTSISNLIQ